MDPANGGCGRRSGGVCAVRNEPGLDDTMAHEVAHALGRKHARGSPQSDPDYPTYNSYDDGSIGEYGFDPITSQVFSPINSHDFMAYATTDGYRRTRTWGFVRIFKSGSEIRLQMNLI